MNYEILQLEEKKVVGLKIRTSNSDPNMGMAIGGVWQRFFGEGIFENILQKKNDKTIGLYTNYEKGAEGLYDMLVCCEVNQIASLENGIVAETIPAGKYAKFIVKGHMQKAIEAFWMKLWSMDLERQFTSDFEEYQSGGDMENGEVHIYIGLK